MKPSSKKSVDQIGDQRHMLELRIGERTSTYSTSSSLISFSAFATALIVMPFGSGLWGLIFGENQDGQRASSPVSPVRMRIACSG